MSQDETAGTIPEICIDMIVLLMDGNPSIVSYKTAVLVAGYPRPIRYEVKSYFLWIRVLYRTIFITALGQIAGDDA